MMVALLLRLALQTAQPNAEVCASTTVIVDTSASLLLLCDQGQTMLSFAVNLGAGGMGKTTQGDRKTPLGVYPLQAPRPSSSGFTWFVPIGYPTREQRKAGYTGSAIGIHGPPDWMDQAIIDVAFATPWTDGCIMVRTKADIEAVRQWLLVRKPTTIELR
jgi:murein L,D-transpeptidase YafK